MKPLKRITVTTKYGNDRSDRMIKPYNRNFLMTKYVNLIRNFDAILKLFALLTLTVPAKNKLEFYLF